MSIKRILFFAILLAIFCNELNSQPGKLPTIIPPSPEIATISNIGNISTGLHTGSVRANIPLFELSVGQIKMPISLSYSSNGIKISDIPSRVGLGWNILNGGVISRVIHDEADGESNYITPPANLELLNTDLFNYLNTAEMAGNDTEFDEYSYSFNGQSGKFFLDAASSGKSVEHNNLKIQKSGTFFIITGADGIKYYFGQDTKVEKTSKITWWNGNHITRFNTTAWFLTKIESPEGDIVTLNYSAVHINTDVGMFQSVILTKPGYSPPYPNCSFCGSTLPPPINNRIEYNSFFLTGISTSNGTQVDFTYEARPDLSGDNRLSEISIKSSNGSPTVILIKKYQFEYQNFDNTGLNKRFYLKKVISVPVNSSLQSIYHSFDYIEPENLPSQYSYSQDYFGYYNGKTNGNLFPVPINSANYINASLGANRNPDFNYSKMGLLKKIIYPTGGYEEFIVEPHTILQDQVNTTYNNAYIGGDGSGFSSPVTRIANFSVLSNQNGLLSINGLLSPGAPNVGDPNYNPANGNFIFATFVLKNTTANTTLFTHHLWSYSNLSVPIVLQPGINYEMKLIVYGITNAANANMKYDPATNVVQSNTPACGVRVAQMISFDPVSNGIKSKYYKYATRAEMSKSTGVGTIRPVMEANPFQGGVCIPGGYWGEIIISCTDAISNLQVSSSSIMPAFTFGGSSVAYHTVLESDDPNFLNGGIEHRFHTEYIFSGTQNILNGGILGAPLNRNADMNGLEGSTIYFKKTGSNYITLKEINNTFSYDSRVTANQRSVITRKRWEPPTQSGISMSDKLKGYDIGVYYFQNSWIHLDRTIVKEYDADGQNPLTTTLIYDYNNATHLQPTRIETLNSKQETIVKTSTFPVDYNTTPYTTMLNNNIITAEIESSTTKNNTVIAKVKTEYKDWWNDGKILKPEIVSVKASTNGTLEPRIRFLKYDLNGNPLEQQKDNDVKVSFIWGYNNQYPIAKIVNADYNTAIQYVNTSILNNPSTTEQQMRAELNNIRTGLLNTKALVTTYTYKPLVGISSETDPNGKTTYYEYDAFNRLSLIRDQDNNILKKICYNYAGQLENCIITACTNTTPDWQFTTSPSRCELIGGQNTGYKEREQQDMNQCSSTANQLRWMRVGGSDNSCPVSTNIPITYQNTSGLSEFTALYRDMGTGQTYIFLVPIGSGTLGYIPASTYELTISKPGNQLYLYFSCICKYASGTSAQFYKVNVTSTTCNTIIIAPDL